MIEFLYPTPDGSLLVAVDSLSFDVGHGEIFGLEPVEGWWARIQGFDDDSRRLKREAIASWRA
jgi:hypothetical protein